MKALFVGMEWFPESRDGGLNRYFYEELQALSAVGVSGTAFVSYCENQRLGDINARAAAGRGASLWERWKGARRIAREALKDADLVNVHFALYASPWMQDIPRNMPLVVNFHGPWADEIAAEATTVKGRFSAFRAHLIERAVYRRADRVITLSEAFRDIAHRRYRIPLDRIRVVPGAVDTAPYLKAPRRTEARERLGWPTERPILLAIRRIARRMGLENLIDAMAEVRRAHPKALLLIGGKGPFAGELEARIAERGLSDTVRLLGFVPDDDLAAAYAAADISIVPTLTLEGFGLITVESLAAGTPVLGTPVGGTPEILRGLEPGLIFGDTTPAAIAAGIDSALAEKPGCRTRTNAALMRPVMRGTR